MLVVPHRDEQAHQLFAGVVDTISITGRTTTARVDGQLERGDEEVVLAAEVVVDQGRRRGLRRDRAHRGTSEAVGGEEQARRRQDRGARVRRSPDGNRAAVPPTSRRAHRRVLARELQRLPQVGLPLGAVAALAGC